jgi:hypothetical protein
MGKGCQIHESDECSKKTTYHEVWKHIWQLKVLGAINFNFNFFWWKTYNNMLPTKENFFKRCSVQDPLCPLRGTCLESMGHILWSCPSLVKSSRNNRSIQKLALMERDGLCLVEQLIGKLDERDLEVAVTVAYRIWLCRNLVVFGGQFRPPMRVALSSLEAVENFHLSNKELGQKAVTLSRHLFLDLRSLSLEKGTLGSDMPA